jgi:pseudaminic acid biosynthesis-associated methylase
MNEQLNEQEEFWQGSFGDSYTDRNQVEVDVRLPFWRATISAVRPRTVLEVGCNRGHNLLAIKEVDPSIEVTGTDINHGALSEAFGSGRINNTVVVPARELLEVFDGGAFDLVFTSGVLIHIPPADLLTVMNNITVLANKHVLAIEYADKDEVEVEYRGHANKLWRRPYGQFYEQIGMKIVDQGPAAGWDQCTYWLMEHAE